MRTPLRVSSFLMPACRTRVLHVCSPCADGETTSDIPFSHGEYSFCLFVIEEAFLFDGLLFLGAQLNRLVTN